MKKIENLAIAVIVTSVLCFGLNVANDNGISTPKFARDVTAWGSWLGFAAIVGYSWGKR